MALAIWTAELAEWRGIYLINNVEVKYDKKYIFR